MKILCSIYDKKGKIHETYFISDFEAQAVKAFKMGIDKNPVYSQWPEDYVLYKVATLNPETGEVIPELKEIITATALVPTPEKPNSGTTEKKK